MRNCLFHSAELSDRSKMTSLGCVPALPHDHEEMNAPSEINAAAIKASAAEKHTPMMRQFSPYEQVSLSQ